MTEITEPQVTNEFEPEMPARFDLRSVLPTDERYEAIRAGFPEVFHEDKVDFDALKRSLGEWVDPGPERFGLTWPGKAECMRIIQEPSVGTLVPMPEESVDWDSTKNVIIEGENLEVLKLLQKAYYGKVKLIYIDPPYNTGKEFIYPDNFREGLADYLRYSGQVDEEGFKTSANTETAGRYHSKWLSMMYPRLFLARNLLSDDGLIFVSIGDHELHNLRALMNEIFGEENYINTICVRSKVAAGASGGGEDRRLKKNIEFMLVFARRSTEAPGFASSYTEQPLSDVIAEMKSEGQSWKYTSVLVDKGERRHLKTIEDGSGNPIEIFVHDGIQRSTVPKLARELEREESDVYAEHLGSIFSDTNAQSSIRQRVIDAAGPLDSDQIYSVEYVPRSGKEKGTRVTHYYISPTVRRVIWLSDVAYVGEDGRVTKLERTGTLWDDIEYNNLGKEGGIEFPNGKKPVQLLERVLDLIDDPEALVLDFFAGSGSLAHTVFNANARDGGNRRSVLIQLPEPIEDSSFSNVAALTRERVRRSARAIEKEPSLLAGSLPDTGFRAYKLTRSAFRTWIGQVSDDLDIAAQLSLATEHSQRPLVTDSMAHELMLKAGFDLSTALRAVAVGDHEVYSVEDGSLLMLLGENLDLTTIEAMVEMNPSLILVLDSAFAGDDELKVNAMQTVRSRNLGSGSDIALKVV